MTETPKHSHRQRLVIGISGASGAWIGIRLLEACRALDVETHLVISKAGEITIAQETSYSVSDVKALASQAHKSVDIGAAIASGSFPTMGMIVAPCSIRSMSEIATGVTSSLLTRAADVTLKERRKLILAVRETPFHTGHLRSMTALSEMGAIIAPPVPAFYTQPETVADIINQFSGHLLSLMGIGNSLAEEWNGLKKR
ncbi:MAG: 3-octaprenyl-4-hydroxybenzoate carboxy-lyase [Sneathiella sp.]|uniref:UbiX family flavin prenyltransferase n=1 Tax=Sneathiella sp. TaxID=1964365 RepID=UPI000C5873BC|nr:UbiX family flavin prenyltransferase [Sneathiella sp.]MAL78415.1 3-octaprenyl-4-hydroxybenzoate carboxy-lyase [Sneathiella sp.]